jgi:hypothetical protein
MKENIGLNRKTEQKHQKNDGDTIRFYENY